ncbi:MAG: ATP-grasp domain-containing protein, partial [Nanoarchaeota archaeon]
MNELMKNEMKGLYLFNKYPEIINGKDKGTVHKFPFIEGNYSSHTIVVETMRGLPIALASGMNFLMPEQAPKIQIEYHKETFGLETKAVEIIPFDNENPEEYESIINNLPEKSLIVLQPYDNFLEKVYSVDPKVLWKLNSKSNLIEIAEGFTPKRIKKSLEQLLAGTTPFVVKKSYPGAAGDGVKVVKDIKNVDFSSFLNDDHPFFVEEFIDFQHNYGIQFFIDKQGQSHYFGHNYQQTSQEGEFLGVTCFLGGNPPSELLDIGYEICENIAKTGYFGFAGLDSITKDGKYYIIDPNIRITASTPAFVLKEQLMDIYGSPFVQLSFVEIKAKSPVQVVET